MTMRVLMLGPWAIGRPFHGGQIRAKSIQAAYQARGHEVIFSGVYDPNNVSSREIGPHDIAIDHEVLEYIQRSGISWEVSLWTAFAELPSKFGFYIQLVQKFDPDVIQFEEPYLWPIVKALRNTGYLTHTKIVHSSYNFETDYRRDLGRIRGVENEAVLEQVALDEIEISAECDLVVVVSNSDAESFSAIGADHVIVALNGCRTIEPSPEASYAAGSYFGDEPYAIFVSSAHPPNARGLLDYLSSKPLNLPGRLVIGGSVCDLLEPHKKAYPALRDALMLGSIDMQLLDALLVRASVVLLPKTRGGGSNLKTSEALLAQRPVVASSQAFVGFERWADVLGVTIADRPEDFWARVRWHMQNDALVLDENAISERQRLSWSQCLMPMIVAIEELVGHQDSHMIERTATSEHEYVRSLLQPNIPEYVRKHALDYQLNELKKALQFSNVEGATVVEIGGDFHMVSARLFAANGAARVITTSLANSFSGEPLPSQVKCHPIDFSKLEVDSHSVDLIYGVAILEHLPDIKAIALAIKRIMRSNGVACLHGCPLWTGPDGHHVWLYQNQVSGFQNLICDPSAPLYSFNSREKNPIPDWAHLAGSSQDLSKLLLENGLADENVAAISNFVFNTDNQSVGSSSNRLSPSEIINGFSQYFDVQIDRLLAPNPENEYFKVAKDQYSEEDLRTVGLTLVLRHKCFANGLSQTQELD